MRVTILPRDRTHHPTVVVTDPVSGKLNNLPCLTEVRARKVAQLAQDSCHYAEFQEKLMKEFENADAPEK
jgi:hypothetical protein